MAPAISRVVTEAELRECIFFQTGGAKYKGMIVQSMLVSTRAKTPAEIKASYERDKVVIGKSYPVKLGVFLKQTSFVVRGVLINREEVKSTLRISSAVPIMTSLAISQRRELISR